MTPQQDEHIGSSTLRRLRAGEALAPRPAIDAHAAACAECRARIKRARRRAAPLRAGDLVRSLRGGRRARGAPAREAQARAARAEQLDARRAGDARPAWSRWSRASPLPGRRSNAAATRHQGRRRASSCASPAANGPARSRASTRPRRCARGERVRIGYQPGAHRYLLALSDRRARRRDAAVPRAGPSLARARRRGEATALPARQLGAGPATGVERIIVVLSDQPIDVDDARSAPRAPPTTKRAATSRACPAWTCRASSSSRTFAKP